VLAGIGAANYSIWLLLPGGAGAAINFWYAFAALKHKSVGRPPSKAAESDTFSSAPNISLRRWKIVLFARLFLGVALVVLAAVSAEKYSIWLLLPWGAGAAINFWYVSVVLAHRPDHP
jgi:hypothetical protein